MVVMITRWHHGNLPLTLRPHAGPGRATDLALPLEAHRLLQFLIGAAAGLTSLSALYVIKCAAGINLLPGQAPVLHSLLYHFIR